VIILRNKYYYCEFDCEGTIVRKNVKVEQNHLQFMGKKDRQIIEDSWGCMILTIKKSTKFNYDKGQF
jgi:hypothetical protein